MSALFIAVLAFGFAAMFTVPPGLVAADPSGKTVLFCSAYGMGEDALDEIKPWLEGLGATVIIARGGLNATILTGVDALILAGFYGGAGEEALNATNGPVLLTTISNWWTSTTGGIGGGKFLWIGSDSDYGSGDWIAGNTSLILETVGSALRHEPTSVEDPVSNCGGGAYRVVANVTESVDPDGAQITNTITHGALFHGPTLCYGVNSTGHDVALHNNTIANVFNIMYTTTNGVIVDANPLIPPLTVSDSQTGSFVMMAGEKDLGAYSNNRIIASGASCYGDYEPMWTDSYYGVGMNGSVLVKQAILWGLEPVGVVIPGPPSIPTLTALPLITLDGMVNLSWTESLDEGSITHYQYQVSDSSGFSSIIATVNTSTPVLTIIADISAQPAGDYYFRVRAFDNDDNPSGWSNVATVAWTGTTPPLPIPGFPFAAIFLALAFALIPILIIRRRRK